MSQIIWRRGRLWALGEAKGFNRVEVRTLDSFRGYPQGY
jgi:hypothetical protein